MKLIKTFTASLLASSFALTAASANAYVLNDNYIGGYDTGGVVRDVIGNLNGFNTLGIDVSIAGNEVTVDIATNFWDDIGIFPTLTASGSGIGVGDLLLADSWSAAGTAASGYVQDNSTTGTVWQYGIAVDNAYSSTGGSATFYKLNGSSNADTVLNSDHFMSNGYYRSGQEVAVNEDSAYVEILSNTASWAVSQDKVSFTFDAADTGLLGGEMGLHWAMMCANDVIEGSVSTVVSEPATIPLLGLGLLSLYFIRRKA